MSALQEKPKSVRLIIEKEDGTAESIEGADLEMWEKGVDSAIMSAYVHGQIGQNELGQVNWKKEKAQELYSRLIHKP